MGLAIVEGFKTKEEALVCLEKYRAKAKDPERYQVIDDREYCGEWTVCID